MKCFQIAASGLILLATPVAAQTGGTYAVPKSVIAGGGGTSIGGTFMLRGTAGQHDAGELAGGTFLLRGGFQAGIADSCPPSSPPEPDLIGLEVSTKNRFLSFSVGDSGQTQGVRVTFASLPPPFDLWNGSQLWVGSTSQVSEAGSSVAPTPGFPNFTAATLRCEPVFVDWSSMGTIHLFHEGIVPGGIYAVDVVDESCDASTASSFSNPLPVTTAIWGDTVLDLSILPPPPAEGSVNVVDALAVLGRFASAPTSIVKARADLEPACLDLTINVSDVLSSLSGFVGLSYPFTPTAGDPCLSTCPSVLP